MKWLLASSLTLGLAHAATGLVVFQAHDLDGNGVYSCYVRDAEDARLTPAVSEDCVAEGVFVVVELGDGSVGCFAGDTLGHPLVRTIDHACQMDPY